MIAVEEVWQCFNGPLAPEHRGRRYFGLNELDRQLAEYIPQSEGVFVEVGAYDGIEQSNSLYFERLGWRGVLIEAVPTTFERCKRNRPLATVVHAACVSPEFQGTEISLVDVGLMSLVDGARRSEQERQAWIQRGEAIQQITSTACAAPARTLMSILVDLGIVQIDLLSVDVEGYEAEVIAGLDLNRIRPRYIVVEDSGTSDLAAILEKAGYQTIAAMNERSFTRDLLFCDRQREK
jgi:FkbM family methyltransferase